MTDGRTKCLHAPRPHARTDGQTGRNHLAETCADLCPVQWQPVSWHRWIRRYSPAFPGSRTSTFQPATCLDTASLGTGNTQLQSTQAIISCHSTENERRHCCCHPPNKVEHVDRVLDIPYTYNKHTHTHTSFNGPMSRTIQVSRYLKGKTNLDFTEARDSKWHWHQLGHMQVCTSLQTDNHTSTPPLSFLQAGCPSCRPTNSIKALKEKHLQQATIKIAPSPHRGGDPGPHVTHGSLGPPESIRQMALKSVRHFYTAHSCDQQIHTHMYTTDTHTHR